MSEERPDFTIELYVGPGPLEWTGRLKTVNGNIVAQVIVPTKHMALELLRRVLKYAEEDDD